MSLYHHSVTGQLDKGTLLHVPVLSLGILCWSEDSFYADLMGLTRENVALQTAKGSAVSKNYYPFFRHCGQKVEALIRTFYRHIRDICNRSQLTSTFHSHAQNYSLGCKHQCKVVAKVVLFLKRGLQMTSRLGNNKYHHFTDCFSSVPLFIIQLTKIRRSPTGVISMGLAGFFLHLCARVLAFQSVKADAL